MGGFRLPEIEELKGLLPILSTDPPVDPEGFTATPIDVFWSATEAGRGTAMVLRFSTASAATSVVTAQNRVRCVLREASVEGARTRAGQRSSFEGERTCPICNTRPRGHRFTLPVQFPDIGEA